MITYACPDALCIRIGKRHVCPRQRRKLAAAVTPSPAHAQVTIGDDLVRAIAAVTGLDHPIKSFGGEIFPGNYRLKKYFKYIILKAMTLLYLAKRYILVPRSWEEHM